MALSKVVSYRGEFFEDGTVQSCKIVKIYDNGEFVGEKKTKKLLYPGIDYSNEDKVIKQVCKALHTEEAIAAYITARQAEQ